MNVNLPLTVFEPDEYWKIKGNVKFEDGFNIEANLLSAEGKKVEKFTFKSEDDAKKL